MARKRRGNSQGLSPTALKAKRDRDLAMAKTPRRTRMRSQNQSIGQNSTRDIHHVNGVAGRTIYQSISENRDTSKERNA
jgi:hypothetical protein